MSLAFPWESGDEYLLARASVLACAYNVVVNVGTSRLPRKMGDLLRAVNHYERCSGTVKLEFLKGASVIDGYQSCPPECEVRPGGLFHVADCENDANHPVSRARRERARELLPERLTYAAEVGLVGLAWTGMKG